MATTTTPSWTENQTFSGGITGQTNIAQTTEAEIDLDTDGYDLVVAQIEITAMGSSTSVSVEVFSSPDSGTTFDTESLPGGFNTDSAMTKTIVIMGHPYVKIRITDDDGTSSVDTDGHYAGRQWSTA